jgi:hypothetical protein
MAGLSLDGFQGHVVGAVDSSFIGLRQQNGVGQPRDAGMASRIRKMPATSVRRLISPVNCTMRFAPTGRLPQDLRRARRKDHGRVSKDFCM